jgi:hypothetical protein
MSSPRTALPPNPRDTTRYSPHDIEVLVHAVNDAEAPSTGLHGCAALEHHLPNCSDLPCRLMEQQFMTAEGSQEACTGPSTLLATMSCMSAAFGNAICMLLGVSTTYTYLRTAA